MARAKGKRNGITAICGLDAQIAHGGTFYSDKSPDLKADYVLANPPFSENDWCGELLVDHRRWGHGLPSASNSNYAWVPRQ